MRAALIGISVLVLGTFLWERWLTQPVMYRQCASPTDDGLMMQVHRARTPPYIEGVDVIVSIRDSSDRVIFNRVISNEDLWSDVEREYPRVECLPDKFIVGPGWWDGEMDRDFVVVKSDLLATAARSSNNSFKRTPLRGAA